MIFDDILEKLESDKKILDFRFSKSHIPIYLVARVNLLQSLINVEFNLSNPHVQPNKKTIKEILHYIYNTLKSNLFFAPKKDIYIFSSGVVNRFEDGQYTNWLYDDLNSLYPHQTQIIESSMKRSYLLPKKETIYFRDLIDIFIELIAKCIPIERKDKENIREFLEYFKNHSDNAVSDKTIKDIENILRKTSIKLEISIVLYKWFLKYKKPKMIIVEDGHYGGYSYLIKIAKELGITIAEYQHGYIGPSHPAYNYHENIFKQVSPFLPEILLTHGEYWSNRVRVPAKKIVIGFPNLTQKLSQILPQNTPKKRILFISGGTVYTQLYNLISSITNDLHTLGLEIMLRPHPSEKPEIVERYGRLLNKNVLIDTQNLYESLSLTDIIVSMEVSTVLFESIHFTKKIYLMKTPYTVYYEPESIFINFENTGELLLNIQNNVIIDSNIDYFWERKWKKNYQNFINNIFK